MTISMTDLSTSDRRSNYYGNSVESAAFTLGVYCKYFRPNIIQAVLGRLIGQIPAEAFQAIDARLLEVGRLTNERANLGFRRYGALRDHRKRPHDRRLQELIGQHAATIDRYLTCCVPQNTGLQRYFLLGCAVGAEARQSRNGSQFQSSWRFNVGCLVPVQETTRLSDALKQVFKSFSSPDATVIEQDRGQQCEDSAEDHRQINDCRRLMIAISNLDLPTVDPCWESELIVLMHDLVASMCLQLDENVRREAPPVSQIERDGWLFERHKEGAAFKQILEQLRERIASEPALNWRPLESLMSIRNAIKRHAERTGQTATPRKRGRPRKTMSDL